MNPGTSGFVSSLAHHLLLASCCSLLLQPPSLLHRPTKITICSLKFVKRSHESTCY